MITDLCDCLPCAASARKRSASDKPPNASPPIFRKLRRVARSQNFGAPSLAMVSMRHLALRAGSQNIQDRGTVPFSSQGTEKSGQSPMFCHLSVKQESFGPPCRQRLSDGSRGLGSDRSASCD